MKTRHYSDKEWNIIPHIVMTDDDNWDPRTMDSNPIQEKILVPNDSDTKEHISDNKFVSVGYYNVIYNTNNHIKTYSPMYWNILVQNISLQDKCQNYTSNEKFFL